MIYTESDHKGANTASSNNSRPGSALSNPSVDEDSQENELPQTSSTGSKSNDIKVSYDDQNGCFQIGKSVKLKYNYTMTITLVFVRNLIKLFAQPQSSNSSEFFFAFKFLNNQFTSKPFGDIVSCQMNVEKCSVRLLTSLVDLKTFLNQHGPLEVGLFWSKLY